MDHIPGRFIEKADDPATLENFLKASKTATTADMNATRVEAEVYLARTLAAAAQRIGASLKDLADTAQKAMNNHANALIDASQASGRYATTSPKL